MLISTRLLKDAGCHVSVEYGQGKDDLFIEISLMDGEPLPPAVENAIADRVGPEYVGSLVEALAIKIHTIQVLEAVNKIERKAWDARRHKNGK